MSDYDSHAWRSHLFEIKGSMVREILGRVSVCVGWSLVVVLISFWAPDYLHWFSISSTAHALVGTALGLLLAFRTNSSYERFWEGRKQWGCIVNECRNLARQSSQWLAADPVLAREVITCAIAFPYALMNRLRHTGEQTVELTGLPAADVSRVNASQHVPLAVLRLITARLTTARERNLIDGFQLQSLDQNVQLLVDFCGACERIRTTPLPFAYVMQLRRLLLIYCFSLPLVLIRDYGWATVPTTLILAYSLFGVEEIGTEIENPFGVTPNDLPLETICAGIETVLSEIRGEFPVA